MVIIKEVNFFRFLCLIAEYIELYNEHKRDDILISNLLFYDKK